MGWLRSNRPEAAPGDPADRLGAITPGVPGHCPACDGLGYIDNIDLGHRYQIQHCKDCGHRWEYLFDEDGAVVGLTELDEHGQPRSRTRIRPLRAAAAGPDATGEPAGAPVDEVDEVDDEQVVELVEEPTDADAPAPRLDDVIDLRDPEPVAATAPAAEAVPEQMSPAEWLRHSLRR
ncbi:MAG TPA: hypothetical protein VFU14_09165 [Acidimicrobiales bacterium]|nr:hypothetical protein [Acidimicrobiales bacterium]